MCSIWGLMRHPVGQAWAIQNESKTNKNKLLCHKLLLGECCLRLHLNCPTLLSDSQLFAPSRATGDFVLGTKVQLSLRSYTHFTYLDEVDNLVCKLTFLLWPSSLSEVIRAEV